MRLIKVVPTVYTPSRALEWHCALTAAAFALVLALPGSTFATGHMWDRFAAVMPEGCWAAFMGTIAAIRICALLINGHWRRTPMLRMATACLGASVWGYVAMLMFVPGDLGLQTGVGIYLVLCGSDIRSAWRAGRDSEIAARVAALMDAAPPAPLPKGFAP